MRKQISILLTCFFTVIAAHAQEGKYATVPGVYKGNMPCEECKIIETELELTYSTDSTGTFSLRDKYISEGSKEAISSRIKGEYAIHSDVINTTKATVIVLNYDNEDKAIYYLLKADGNLLPLDKEKRPITAQIDCTLKRLL